MPTPAELDEVATRLDRIQELADELSKCHRDVLDQMELSGRLHREVLAVKIALHLPEKKPDLRIVE
jgi:hypothetical protein